MFWLSDLLSKYGDEDSEEGSEASKKRYATIALSSCDDENYELVETGPLAVAYTPTGRILHFNLKAKDIDEPSAAVETFFGELTETNTNDFIVENVICLGSSDSLPGNVTSTVLINVDVFVYCYFALHLSSPWS